MDCGHQCRITCHPFDRDHKELAATCVEPCRRVPSACKESHACPKLCKHNCGRCMFHKGRFQLIECSHWVESVRCYEITDEKAVKRLSEKCSALVKHEFQPCGHQQETTCANAKQAFPSCPSKCQTIIDSCGHACANICSECDGNHKCDQVCMRKLFCGHECKRKCHDGHCPPCDKQCIVRCVHSCCPKDCKQVCSSCVETCDWQCEHQGRCELVCGAPCSRLPCNKRCAKFLSCGHRCPSVCGEKCPDKSYCQQCCADDTRNAVVDLIMMSSYDEHDVDNDPVIVLPCGHFFSTFSLDGHFGMNEVYARQDSDSLEYDGTLPLAGSDIHERPRTCPDCRAVVHSINRYGRIFRLSELRSLERKHKMYVEKALKRLEYHVDQRESTTGLIDELKKIEDNINKGPMKRIYDACIVKRDFAEVPAPSQTDLVRTFELMGRVYANAATSRGDENDNEAWDSFRRAIAVADASTSLRAGCRVRLHLVTALSKWMGYSDDDKKEAIAHLDWVMKYQDRFPDLGQQANLMKQSIAEESKKIIAEVMRAVSASHGDYYVSNWAAHWFECPNGHPYFIGECGGAMEESHCLECGEAVGGRSHNLRSTNRQVGGVYAEAMTTQLN